MDLKAKTSPGFLILCAAVSVFAGRAWQHLFWDAPFREFLWDPGWMSVAVTKFTSFSWEEYVTSPLVEEWVQRLVFLDGLFYLVCLFATIFIPVLPKQFRVLLWMGSLNLFLLALLYLKEYFLHIGQLFEYALQCLSPFFLYLFLKKEKIDKRLALLMKAAVAVTFISHGLYAIGYYPTPGIFFEMTMNSLGLGQDAAKLFLKVAGWLDILVATGIFLPKKYAQAILLYAAFWGLATALARVVGNFYWGFPLESLHQWLFEAVYRLPHFFVPLALWFYAKSPRF